MFADAMVIKLVVSGTGFQRHGDGSDKDTSPLDDFRVATLPEDDLSPKYNFRVGQLDRYEEAIVISYDLLTY